MFGVFPFRAPSSSTMRHRIRVYQHSKGYVSTRNTLIVKQKKGAKVNNSNLHIYTLPTTPTAMYNALRAATNAYHSETQTKAKPTQMCPFNGTGRQQNRRKQRSVLHLKDKNNIGKDYRFVQESLGSVDRMSSKTCAKAKAVGLFFTSTCHISCMVALSMSPPGVCKSNKLGRISLSWQMGWEVGCPR